MAAQYLAANTTFHVKRITRKAVILHCADPSIRIRVGERVMWRQKRLISRRGTEWIDMARLKLSTQEVAARAQRAAQARQAQAAGRG